MQIKHLQMLAFSVVTPSIHGSKSLGRPAEYLVNVYGVAAKAYNFARQEVLNLSLIHISEPTRPY